MSFAVRRTIRCRESGNGTPSAVDSLRPAIQWPDIIHLNPARMGAGVALLAFRPEAAADAPASLAYLLLLAVDLLLPDGSEPAIVRFPQRSAVQLPGRMHVPLDRIQRGRPPSAADTLLPGIPRRHLLRTTFHNIPQFSIIPAVGSFRPLGDGHHTLRLVPSGRNVAVVLDGFFSLGRSQFHGTADRVTSDDLEELVQCGCRVHLPGHRVP